MFFRFRLFIAHILLKLAEFIKPKKSTLEIEYMKSKQQNLRLARAARLKGDK